MPKKATVAAPKTQKAKPKPSTRDKITRAQAIKLFCVECMGYNKHFVKACPAEQCPLWPYRSGYGQQHTDMPIFVPATWPKDTLVTEDAPEDNR